MPRACGGLFRQVTQSQDFFRTGCFERISNFPPNEMSERVATERVARKAG